MTSELTGIMKSIALLLICAVAFGEALKPYTWCSGEFLKDSVLKCSAEYGATQADVDDFIYLRAAASEEMKCFQACIYSECQLFNKRGRFVPNVAETTAHLASRRNPTHYGIAEDAAKDCVKSISVGNDICDTLEAYSKCITERSPITLSYEGAY